MSTQETANTPQPGQTPWPPPNAVKPPAKPGIKLPWYATLCIAIVLMCIPAGFLHVVYGGGVGLTVCTKERWELADTFVDAGDFVDKPFVANLHRLNTMKALIRAEILTKNTGTGD